MSGICVIKAVCPPFCNKCVLSDNSGLKCKPYRYYAKVAVVYLNLIFLKIYVEYDNYSSNMFYHAN